MKTLLIGTTNEGKIRELRDLLTDVDLELKSLEDFDPIPEPSETGATFEENAALKAAYYADALNLTALADDSGLEVAALNNRPGVYSARFAGISATDEQNIAKLLKELRGQNDVDRSAVFRCAMTIAAPGRRILFSTSASCAGRIDVKPTGVNGFGYDPVFIPNGFDYSFGVLSENIKKRLSHRAAAARETAQFLLSNYRLLT